MNVEIKTWTWESKYPWRPYHYFSFRLLKSLRGFSLQIILPIGALLWRFNYPQMYIYMTPRFAINWKRVDRLKDGGLLFEKSWVIQ